MTEQSLIAEYADIGVSCGYIGGVGVHGDDRSFKVFTRLATQPHKLMSDVSIEVFTVPHAEARTWKYSEEQVQYDTLAIRTRLNLLRHRLALGELHLTIDHMRKLGIVKPQTPRYVTAVAPGGRYLVGIVTTDGRIRVDYHGELSRLSFYETRWYDPKNPWAGGQPEEKIDLTEAGLTPDWT